MKLLIWLVIVPLLVIAALFAISNREPVAVGLWPFFDGVTMPLFVALIGTLYIGFVLGAVVAWWGSASTRAKARNEARRAEQLRRENESLQSRLDAQAPKPPGVAGVRLPGPPASIG